MTKKILFLLTFLLTTLGGGNSAWAATYVINWSNTKDSHSEKPNGDNTVDYTYTSNTGSGLTLKYTREADKYLSGGNEDCIKYSNGYHYTVSGIPATETITSIEFYGYAAYPNSTAKIYLNDEDTGKSFVSTTELPVTSQNVTGLSLTGGFEFHVSGTMAGIKITITTDDRTIDNIYSGAYPYTWRFNVPAEQWTKSKNLLMNSSSWYNNENEARLGATSAPADNGIDIIKGLAFSNVTAATDNSGDNFTKGTLCLDWKNRQLWMNCTVTIPNLTVGQTITFESSDDVQGDAAVGSKTGKTFTVETAGPATFTVDGWIWSISVSKALRTLSFGAPSYTISFGTTESHTATPSPATGATITYSSSDDNVATVDENTGVITTVNSGTCTITATAAETETYSLATASYTLTVNGSVNPTITMSKSGTNVTEGEEVETVYGSSITVTGTVTGTSSAGLTVKYRSADESIATVDASGKISTKNGGTVRIYVFTEGFGNINPAETYYNLKINAANFVFHFLPTSGKVNQGKNITPHTNFPTIYAEDLTSITAESSNTGVATVPTTLWDKDNPSYDYLRYHIDETTGKHIVDGLKPTIFGEAEGEATISINFVSAQYSTSSPATYTVTVTPSTGLNFDWASKDELTMYEGDYMMMPAITGNANGYPFDQNDQQRYVWAMTQDNTHVTSLSWYNTNYHPGEGEPFYWLTDGDRPDNDKLAYILYAESSESRSGTHPEGLMIYARKAGTVKIHAKDMQLNQELSSTITLNILPKANIYGNTDNGDDSDGKLTVEQKSITYPYTWDFTKDFSTTDLDDNSYYWTKSGTTYSNGLALQNSDYGDDNHDGNNAGSQRLYKAILANGNTIPAFKGMTVQLQGTYFDSKYGRITLKPTAGDGNSHLHVNGGPQYFQLPAPALSGTDPESYRVYVKAKPTQSGRGEIRLIVDGNNSYWFENAKNQFHEDGIYWAPVERGQDIKVAFQDVDVYWIAVSTEARTLMRPENTTYAAATYSYNEDLDLIKSNEANGVTAYYASSFTVEKKDVSAGSTTGVEPQYAVMMKPLTSLNGGTATYVTANKGILLKKNADVGNADCYMIANPKNVDSYIVSETITGDVKNYLVGTGASSADIAGKGTDASGPYTNFLMGYAYKYYTDVTDPNSGSEYRFDRDWSFYPLIVSGTYNLAAQRCYLKIPGNLYVDRNGNLVVMPSSSRRSAGESAEAPATKAALSIVFDDDPLTGQGTTGISTVATETTIDSDAWYTLQGVRVETPTKGGIYIHKGRKIVVK